VIHAYLRYLAKRAGFDPEEIRIAVLQPPNMLAALQTKQVDGFAMAPPWVQKPVLDGDAVMVASGPDGDPSDMVPFANTVAAAKPDTCVRRKALCQGVGATFREAVGIMLDRPAEALAVVRKRFAQFDERQVAAAFEDVRKITPRSLLVSKAGLENEARILADLANAYRLNGDLTIKGVTKPVLLQLEFNGVEADRRYGQVSRCTASITLDRKDFGINTKLPLGLGNIIVGPKVTVTLEIEAARNN